MKVCVVRAVIIVAVFLAVLAPHPRVFASPDAPGERVSAPTAGDRSEGTRPGADGAGNCPWPTLMELRMKLHEGVDGPSREKRDGKSPENTLFWAEKERGWFFGESERADGEGEPGDPCRLPSLAFITPDLLKRLPAPVFRRLITDLMNYAVTHPTEENVAVYMLAQWIAREKAERFMLAWSDVLRAHPSLDYTVARAPFAYATKIQVLETARSRERFLREAARRDEIALVAFVSPDCVYCASQMPILLDIRRKYGIRIAFVNLAERPEAVERFGIEAVPEIWLAVRNRGMMRISAGLRSAQEILEAAVKAYERLTGKRIIPDIYRYTVTPEEIDLTTVKEPRKEVSPWERGEEIPLR